jgi:phosphoribosylformylglycinamidine synthase
MAFGGQCGLRVDIGHRESTDPLEVLFSEEVGWVLEIDGANVEKALFKFKKAKVPVYPIGVSVGFGPSSRVEVSVQGNTVVDSLMVDLYQVWEETSWQLEKRQANPVCVTQEYQSLRKRTGPQYRFSFNPKTIPISVAPSHGL